MLGNCGGSSSSPAIFFHELVVFRGSAQASPRGLTRAFDAEMILRDRSGYFLPTFLTAMLAMALPSATM